MLHTTPEQAKKLREAGLSYSSADMMYVLDFVSQGYQGPHFITKYLQPEGSDIILWSLDSLEEILLMQDRYEVEMIYKGGLWTIDLRSSDGSIMRFRKPSKLDAIVDSVIWYLKN